MSNLCPKVQKLIDNRIETRRLIDRAKNRRDGTLTGHRQRLKNQTTEQLIAESKARGRA